MGIDSKSCPFIVENRFGPGFRVSETGIPVKGGERILGDSDFEEKYDLKARGYDFDRLTERVAEVMKMEIGQVTAFGKSPQTVRA